MASINESAKALWDKSSAHIKFEVDPIATYSYARINFDLGKCKELCNAGNSAEIGFICDMVSNNSSQSSEFNFAKAKKIPIKQNDKSITIDDLPINQKYQIAIYFWDKKQNQVSYTESKYFYKSSSTNDNNADSDIETLAETTNNYPNQIIFGKLKTGGSPNTEYGFCYVINTLTDPNINNGTRVKCSNKDSNGKFSYEIENLNPKDYVYYSAYAIKANGNVHYGASKKLTIDKSFTTISFDKTISTELLDYNKINLSATISDASAVSIVTEKGFCYLLSTSPSSKIEPTIDNFKTAMATDFSKACSVTVNLDISGYKNFYYIYIRPYAITAYGTNYGNVEQKYVYPSSFDVINSLPYITNITSSSLKCNVSMASINLTFFNEVGVCWANGYNTPTINDNKISIPINSMLNAFDHTFDVSPLKSNQIFTLRSYSISTTGIKYSPTKTITTL